MVDPVPRGIQDEGKSKNARICTTRLPSLSTIAIRLEHADSESVTIPFLLHTVATNLRKRRERCHVESDYCDLLNGGKWANGKALGRTLSVFPFLPVETQRHLPRMFYPNSLVGRLGHSEWLENCDSLSTWRMTHRNLCCNMSIMDDRTDLSLRTRSPDHMMQQFLPT